METQSPVNTLKTFLRQRNPHFCGYQIQDLKALSSKADLLSIMSKIEREVSAGNYKWVPLGGDDNNLGRINQLSYPESGISENLANAMDALIEKEIQKGNAFGMSSPQEVVSKNGLEKNDKLIQLSICSDDLYYDADGAGERRCATLEIRDFGVGLTASKMPETILALGSNTKNNDPRYGGRFGQGGSTALTFLAQDGASLYMTRHYESDEVAFTFVQRHKSHRHRNPFYRYLIDTKTGLPPVLKATRTQKFRSGTLIRHFGYKLDRRDLTFYSQAKKTKTSLYNTLFDFCIDPLIPFRVFDKRIRNKEQMSRKQRNGERIPGALHRLYEANDRLKEHQGQEEADVVYISPTHHVPFEDNMGNIIGHVDLIYAVAGFLVDSKGNPKHWIDNLVNRGDSGKIYLSGMAVDNIPRDMVRRDLRMPHLDNYMIVYVNLNGLEDDALTNVLKPDRESMSPGFKEILLESIFSIMREDDQLHYWNEKRKKRENSSQVLDDTITRIRNSFKNRISGKSSGKSIGQRSERRGPREVTPFEPINLSDPPTFIEVITPGPKSVWQGRSFGFTIKSDASRFFLKHRHKVHVDETLVDIERVRMTDPNTGTSQGYNMFTGFRVRPEVPVGTSFTVTVSLLDENNDSKVIDEASLRCIVKEEEEKYQTGLSAIEVKWINQEDAYARGINDFRKVPVTFSLDLEDILTVYLVEGAVTYSETLDLLASDGRKGSTYDQYAQSLRGEYEYRMALAAIRYYLDTRELPEYSGEEEEPSKYEIGVMRAAESICEFFADYYRDIF